MYALPYECCLRVITITNFGILLHQRCPFPSSLPLAAQNGNGVAEWLHATKQFWLVCLLFTVACLSVSAIMGPQNGGNVLAYDPHDTPLFVCLPLLAHLGACQYLLWCQDFFVVFSQIQAPPEYKPPIFEKNSLVGACIRECRVSNDPPEQRSSLPEPLVKHLRRSFASYLM